MPDRGSREWRGLIEDALAGARRDFDSRRGLHVAVRPKRPTDRRFGGLAVIRVRKLSTI